jgi:hypothetical protein
VGIAHTTAAPGTHTPLAHVSCWVQAFPSLQGVPLVGAQVPVLAEQAEQPVHVAGSFCHFPVASHVCGWAVPLHCLDPGLQTPVHAPLVASQRKLHAFPLFCHCPVASHVCGWVPLHWTEFGVHTPVHACEVVSHAYGHAAPVFCQSPVASHVWGWRPLHCLAPALQAPHDPALHTIEHAAADCHWPVGVHVCGTRPVHCVEFGVQSPLQLPALQTVAHALPSSCHSPSASHDWG